MAHIFGKTYQHFHLPSNLPTEAWGAIGRGLTISVFHFHINIRLFTVLSTRLGVTRYFRMVSDILAGYL